MAQIVTITNPLTGQPAQVDQLEHTAQQIDDATSRALPGGAIDIDLAKKIGGIESTEHPGCYYRMVASVMEWVNPPMEPNKEYRTTERYLGKPVYVKAINFGALTNASASGVNFGVGQSVFRPIDFGGIAVSSGGSLSYALPSYGNNSAENDIALSVFGSYVWIKTYGDYSNFTATVWVKYYKSTD